MYRRGQFMKLSRNLSGEKNEFRGMSRSGDRVGAQDLQKKYTIGAHLKLFEKRYHLRTAGGTYS
jgi:hypothetical protein